MTDTETCGLLWCGSSMCEKAYVF